METMEGCMAKAMDPEVLWHGKTHGISDHAEIHGKSHGAKKIFFKCWWPATSNHVTNN